MLGLIASAALAATGPVDGFCVNYSYAGNSQCVMWASESSIYIYDGLNTIKYTHVYGPVYEEFLNRESRGHKICDYDQSNVSCFFGVEFQTNED